jgi:hypothetical protein
MYADKDTVTPEQHHDRLMDAIEYELDEHGPGSLAEIIGCMLERYDEEDTSEDAVRTRAWSQAFHDLAYGSLPEPSKVKP